MDGDPEQLNPNPIVAMAMRIRARKDVVAAIDSATPSAVREEGADAAASLAAFADALAVGAKRLNSILGKNAMLLVRLERPLRVRLRFGEKRVSLNVDEPRQLVVVRGLALDGDYQFDTGSASPALINLSLLSTDVSYGEALTPTTVLTAISQGARLPRPAHLDELGPMRF